MKPEAPDSLFVAQKSLQNKLGLNVATAYGLGEGLKGPARWLLYVFTDGPKSHIPKIWEGFDVRVAGIPRALT